MKNNSIININKSDAGNFYDFLNRISLSQAKKLSFLDDNWVDLEQWKNAARKKVLSLLSYSPPPAPLSPNILNTKDCGSFIQEEVQFNTSAFTRINGTVLIPKNVTPPYPAFVAIHDHGGFYYYGKEKIIDSDIKSKVLLEFKDNLYEGRSWANELVLKGYLVLVVDAFYFGDRRLNYDELSDQMKHELGNPLDGNPLDGFEIDSDPYISAFNDMCNKYEQFLVRHINTAGITWPGILAHDDRISVDYLLSRRDVDPSRIGCGGLSIGALRTMLLAATDSRIKCAVSIGWMPTMESLQHSHLRFHTFMAYIAGLGEFMDYPDMLSLLAPNYLLVQQCRQDMLFTEEGMIAACDIIQAVYDKAGAPDHFKATFYDCPHIFTVNMQEEAKHWIEEYL